MLVPMRSLGPDNWKIASALMGSYIGGSLLKIRRGMLPAVTTITIVLAPSFPDFFNSLAPSAETISLVLMQVFFTILGATGSVWNVINTAPSIFLFAVIQVMVHLAMTLLLGKLFCIDMKLLLLASKANIGGPTTACAMATAKGWTSLVIPEILSGLFGVSIATFLGIGCGVLVLEYRN